MFKRKNYLIVVSFAVLLAFPSYAQSPGTQKAVDEKAVNALRGMSDYMNTLGQFSLHLQNSVDTLLETGQKIQLGRSVDVSVKRPDRLRVDIKGDFLDQQLFYEGKRIILYDKKTNGYGTLKAPATIESALDHAERYINLVAPAADLIYKNSYDILMQDVNSGGYIGLSTIFGVECHHLAFRAQQTDWQIWIENSKTPLPRKFVITSKWTAGAPQFTALITKWDVDAQLDDNLFSFTAPDKAIKIEFLTD